MFGLQHFVPAMRVPVRTFGRRVTNTLVKKSRHILLKITQCCTCLELYNSLYANSLSCTTQAWRIVQHPNEPHIRGTPSWFPWHAAGTQGSLPAAGWWLYCRHCTDTGGDRAAEWCTWVHPDKPHTTGSRAPPPAPGKEVCLCTLGDEPCWPRLLRPGELPHPALLDVAV